MSTEPPGEPTTLDTLPQGARATGFMGMGRCLPGERPSSDVLSPTLLADGSIELTEADGQILGPYRVDHASLVRTTASMDLRGNRETEWVLHKLELVVSASRIAYRVVTPESDGSYLAGHIRHSWVTDVGFRPRQGWLYPPALSVGTPAHDTRASTLLGWLAFSFDFPKEFDSGALAQQVIQRVAQHMLRQPDFPPGSVVEMTGLCGAPRLDNPPKKELAEYDLPAYRQWPGSTEWVAGKDDAG